MLGAEIPLAKVVGSDFVKLGRENVEIRKRLNDQLGCTWRAEQVDQYDILAGHLREEKNRKLNKYGRRSCVMSISI